MKVLEARTTAGMDWHDTYVKYDFLTQDESYNISDPDKAIAEYVFKEIKALDEFLTKFEDAQLVLPSVDEILKCLTDEDVEISLGVKPLLDKDGNPAFSEYDEYIYEYSVEFDGKKLYFEYKFGQSTSTTEFAVKEIPDENVRYIACENILVPFRGVPSIQRFYTAPVKDLEDAKEILENIQTREEWPVSRRELLIADIDEIIQTTWFAQNILAINARNRLDAFNSSYPKYAVMIPREFEAKLDADKAAEALIEASEKWSKENELPFD